MIPAQIPMNSAGIITPSRMVTQEFQRQQNQGEVFHNNSGIPQLPSVNPSLSMGSMSLLTNIGTINSFKGNTTENIQEWLTQFNWVADINKWSEDIRCALLPGYLDDVAKIWYSTLSMRDRGNYQIIQNKLLQAFQQVIFPVQHLNQLLLRTQSEQESVETYAYNKLKLCEDLNKEMAETDKITYLIQGMKSQLRSYLLDKKPSSVAQAIQLAREKQNNLNLNMELRNTNSLAASTAVVNQYSTKSTSHTTSTPVKLIAPVTTESSVSVEMEETLSQIRQLQQEIKEINNSQREVIRRLENNQGIPNNYNTERRDTKPYTPQRTNQWTSEGKPVCRRCSKVGHIARNCRQVQPYTRPQDINKYGKYQPRTQRQGNTQWPSSNQVMNQQHPFGTVYHAQQHSYNTQSDANMSQTQPQLPITQQNMHHTTNTQVKQI